MGYIQKYYGDDSYFPDSARKRHNRYLDDHNEIMVFNFGGGGGCCGNSIWGSGFGLGLGCCHHRNTFWGGFAHGLGAGLSNMLSGFGMGLMGLCMPMFNMFSMPSWGMPMWGGFMPYSGIGFGGSSGNSNQVLGSGPKATPETPAQDKTAEDELKEKIDALKGKARPSSDDLNTLLSELKAKKRDLPAGKYDEFLTDLKKFAKENKLTIDNKILEDESVVKPIDDKWKVEPLSGLSAEKIAELENIGVKPVNIGTSTSPEWCLSLPADDKMTKANLDLLKGTGMAIAVANNSRSGNIDHWIAGKIDDIAENNGLLSFTVDCSKCNSSKYKYTYDVQKNSGSGWSISYKSGYEAADDDLYTKKNTAYNLSDGCLKTSSAPVISTRHGNGYTKLQ